MPGAEDEGHLNTLAICHFIYGGLVGLGGLFGIIYVALGLFMAAGSMGASGGAGGPPPAAVGGILAAIGGFITLFLWALAGCVVYSGLSLRRRRRRVFSIVVACFCCMNIPLGTALGVFTLLVLARESVKRLYERIAYYGS
jgi:hypothetical protein